MLPPAFRRLDAKSLVLGTTVGLVVYLVGGPLLMLAITSFKRTQGRLPFEEGTPLTLENYSKLLLEPRTYEVALNTLVFAGGSLVVGFTLSIALAWLIERTDMPLRTPIFVAVIASTGIPAIVLSIAWAMLANPVNGLVNLAIRPLFGVDESVFAPGPLNIYTMLGLVFVQGVKIVPITLLLISGSFRAMDPALEHAASTSGARFRTVMRRITIPLLTPALLAALIYQFITVVEAFDVPLILGLRGDVVVLSTRVYQVVRGTPLILPDYGAASAYAGILLAIALGPLILYNVILARSERYATIGGHSYGLRRIALGRWKYVVLLFPLAYVLVATGLPAIVLLWMSLQPFFAVPSADSFSRISLEAYASVISSGRVWSAALNTLIVATTTAIATTVLVGLVGWIVVRSRSRFRAVLDILAYLPHAFPGVMIGLSFLLIYLMIPNPIYGTLWIIALALTTQYISIGTRIVSAGIAQIKVQLEEAAYASGASWWHSFTKILVPLMFPAFMNCALIVFIASMENLTLPVFLGVSGTEVVSRLIWDRFDKGAFSEVAALGLMLMLITSVLALGIRRLSLVGGPSVR